MLRSVILKVIRKRGNLFSKYKRKINFNRRFEVLTLLAKKFYLSWNEMPYILI
jgi:hypothetical protein